MRTKMLILSAACAVAGSVAVNAADPVYSVNAVGYVNVTCPHGFSIIANPLIAGTNKLSALIPNPPQGTRIYEFGSDWQIATFDQDDSGNWAWMPDLDFAPGTGAWIYNPSNTTFTNTFVGEVAQGLRTNQIPAGFSLKGSIVPQSGQLDTLLEYVPKPNDRVYLFRNNDYLICNYDQFDNGDWGWVDHVPTPNVGEGFWVYTTKATSWIRNFDVNK